MHVSSVRPGIFVLLTIVTQTHITDTGQIRAFFSECQNYYSFMILHQREVISIRLSDLVEEFIKYQMHKASTPFNFSVILLALFCFHLTKTGRL